MAFSLTAFIKGILLQDETDRSKQLILQISPSATTGTTTTITAAQTGNRTVTLPDSNFDFNTVITTTSVSTLSNKTLDNSTIETIKDANLTLQNTADVSKQVKFDLSGISASTTRTIALPDSNAQLVNLSSSQSLSNKSLDNTTVEVIKDSNFTVQNSSDITKQFKFDASAISTSTTRTFVLPDISTTIVGTAAVQTLTNKILSGNTASNLINGAGTLNLNSSGTITVPNATDTLVGKATTDVLSNKSFPSIVLNGSISGTFTLQPSATTSSYSVVLPAAQGAANTVPRNDGSGNLSWVTALTNPMTTGGDLIYGGASGVPTRLANGSSGQLLKSNGGTSAPSWTTATQSSQQSQTFTASGTFVVPAGVNFIMIEGVGGGGGGGSGSSGNTGSKGQGGGGGGGSIFTGGFMVPVTPAESLTIVVGAGGAGGGGSAPGGNGNPGSSGSASAVKRGATNIYYWQGGPAGSSGATNTSTTFLQYLTQGAAGGLISTNGGVGGAYHASTGGTGGTQSGGGGGGGGGASGYSDGTVVGNGGNGGNGSTGGGSTAGQNGAGYGAGGGGGGATSAGGSSTAASGNGADGVVIINWVA